MCDKCDKRKEEQWEGWNWTQFWKGKLSNKFIAFVVYMVFQFICIFHPRVPSEWTGHILIVSACITFIFMLAGAIDTAVENAKITANFEAKLTKQIEERLSRGSTG